MVGIIVNENEYLMARYFSHYLECSVGTDSNNQMGCQFNRCVFHHGFAGGAFEIATSPSIDISLSSSSLLTIST